MQYIDHVSYGDAVSNDAIFIHNYLTQQNIETKLYVGRRKEKDPLNEQYCSQFIQEEGFPSSVPLIFHFCSYSPFLRSIASHSGPKCMIYHNMTPIEFFDPWNLVLRDQINSGFLQLKAFIDHVDCAVGDSEFNCAQLRLFGYKNVYRRPLAILPHAWGNSIDDELDKKLRDGRTNIVFIGRISPNKRQDQCLRWFKSYLQQNPLARLIITGSVNTAPDYSEFVLNLAKELDIFENVLFTGHIDDKKILTVMRAADLYLSFSEHEGFGVPLIEAMWFDVPVLAYAAAAVPETLGGAGMLFYDNQNFEDITLKVTSLLKDTSLRDTVLKKQKLRRADFLPESVGPYVDEILRKLACHV